MTPQMRIRRVLRDSARIEDAAVRAQLRILRATRRDILARLVNAGAFDRYRLTTLLQAVDSEISRGRDVAQAAAGSSAEQSYGLGSTFSRSVISADSIVGTSGELARAVVDVTTDQVRDVWRELGSRLKTVIRRATLGVSDPFEAMKTLSRSIRDPKTFGRALWRAEAIVRTEVGRAFSVASQSELERGARAGVKVRKYWLTAGDERVREAHRRAGEEYGPDSSIPHDEAFIVDGERLLFPGDPNGSPGNTINCRCVSVPVVMED